LNIGLSLIIPRNVTTAKERLKKPIERSGTAKATSSEVLVKLRTEEDITLICDSYGPASVAIH
jgi:hypothetical protein